jgi:riboflavin synthase
MFTGIVVDVGRIVGREVRDGDVRLTIAPGRLRAEALRLGDSICVQGCCLTVAAASDGGFSADLSRETLDLTSLGELAVGAAVNLEPALRAGDVLGGHLVSGHIDDRGRVSAVQPDARSLRLTIAAPTVLMRYISVKGSITVDGVSLTVNEVADASFGVNIIPHTQSVTTLGALGVGSAVNLEVDQLARYLERLLRPAT